MNSKIFMNNSIKRKKTYYQEIDVNYCCSKMKDSSIGFGEYGEIQFNEEKGYNIYKCFPYPEGTVWVSEPIRYCPFCGEKIVLEITKNSAVKLAEWEEPCSKKQ